MNFVLPANPARMQKFSFDRPIKKLDSSKSTYYFLEIDRETVEKLEKKRATRLVCVLEGKISFPCGLNPLGGGNYFIMLAKARMTALDKSAGDQVHFEIYEHPEPLGVEMPEVLQILLDDDERLRETFEQLTDGKKRNLIFSILNVKDVDRQVRKILDFLANHKPQKRGDTSSYS